MTNGSEKWAVFAERVGGPTVILLVMLFGIYSLTRPITISLIEFLTAQTELMKDIRDDLRQTRIVVELQAEEGKAEMLNQLLSTVTERFDELEVILRPVDKKENK